MADDVPVCDVLSEAMEYLAKLGSNLRCRSESLKAKRISKEKLRNYHAIQKAANKVLLICQLSKKSLENVEAGVRKILRHSDASQQPSASTGGKKSDHLPSQKSSDIDRVNKRGKSSPDKKDEHSTRRSFENSSTEKDRANSSSEKKYYFEYQSCKLKISRRIPVKHFTSVKVLARRIPTSMMDKYPVYYNCKLYRRRQRHARNETDESAVEANERHKENADSDNKNQESITDKSAVIESKNEENETKSQAKKEMEIKEQNTSERNKLHTKCPDSTGKKQNFRRNSSVQCLSDSDAETKPASDESKKLKCENTSVIDLDSPMKISPKKKRKKTLLYSDSSEDDKQHRSHKKPKHYSDSSGDDKQSSSLKQFNDQPDSFEEEQRKRNETKTINLSSDEDNKQKKKRKTSNEHLEKKRVIESSEEKVTKEEANKDPNTDVTDIINLNSPDQESSVIEQENMQGACASVNKTEQEQDPPQKPLIKLVSLSKLLKPDILEIEVPKSEETSGKDKVASKAIRSIKKIKFKDEEDFWAEKRKLVKSFKPKQFTIRIERLPDMTVAFLEANNLKKITRGQLLVCDVSLKQDNEKMTKAGNAKEACNSETVQPELIDKVKSALLNDSESDKSDSEQSDTQTKNTDNVKESLLNDSDSDKNEGVEQNREHGSDIEMHIDKQENIKNKNKNSKNAENNTVKTPSIDCELNTDKEKIESTKGSSSMKNGKKLVHTKDDDTTVIKNALLNESDSDSNCVATKEIAESNIINSVEPQNSSDSDPQITIKKSRRVKKALLNDSDSEKSVELRPDKISCNAEIEETASVEQHSKELQPDVNTDTAINKTDDKESGKQGDRIECPSPEKVTKNSANSLKDMKKSVSDDQKLQNKISESTTDCKDDVSSKEVEYNDGDDNKNSKIDSDDKERHKTPSPPPGDEKDITKSSLLQDSSGESPKPSKRKRNDSTTRSKRKHIMESMHAKKMLLTYSSSSDTEDEKLKSAVKNIKNELETLKSKQENLPGYQRSASSSDSDIGNILKRRKKKKKTSDGPSEESPPKENADISAKQDDGNTDSSTGKMGRSNEKPGSSSSHSDNQDDKDIEGLTNLKSLTSRRRNEGSKQSKSKKGKTVKAKHITGQEGLVEAPSSSEDNMSAEGSDVGEEDLPPVSLSGLNGSAMEHLAKDDLLGESDSDSSKDKEQDDKSSDTDVKKEEDSENEKIKSKRRKAILSSDSEAGSSKRKDPNVKLSDFEDSEDDSSESNKKNKRKKKGSDSDASGGSSEGGSKKKRRRIKTLDSDASGSDDELGGKNKHGRKNIRKVMGKNQLEEATKKAAREEKERLARIAERQKMYNNLAFDESGKPDEVVLDKVVLDFDPETKEPLIEVDRGLVKKLKPHQANGIKFMWDACFESVKRIKKDKGSGCILAHCMGLGKTLQVVSLTHTLLINSDLTGVNRVLVVCPLSTVLNWVNEFRMWLKHAETDYEVDVYELSRFKQNSERAFQLSQWFTHGGVCVLGYEMFRNLSADNVKKFKKKMLRQFQESLVDPGPQLVVCDEGHLLKNEKTSLSQSMNRIKTRRRIVLTGTPLQNNLKEYYCMVQFVKPNLLGKYNEYLNRFVNPITNGQYTDSTEQDIRVMKRRSHVLHKMLDGAVQRRDYSVLAPFLPPKHEYVLFITLTDLQAKLYQHYLDNYSRRPLAGKSSGFLFPDFQSLQRIWTHPLVLKYNSERYEIMQQKKREREEEDSEGSLADFIDDESTPDESTTEEDSSELSDVSDDSRKKSRKKKAAKKGKDRKVTTRRATRANPVEHEEEPIPDVIEVKNDNPTEWWIPMVTEDEIEDLRYSHKLVLLFEILRQCEAIGDKVLVFSQSLYSLDLIEHFLGKVDEATQEGRIDDKLGGHVGSWSPGIDYFRLDGSTSCENRSIWCKNFNREDNPRARLFLISTRAGGLGINLVAANRVVIFDVSWNPSHDVQSIFRVYRFGQKKPCYIYRFLAMGTMEEKIYERQVTKQAISKRVIDEQQIDRHYAENDLAELYKFEPKPPEPRPVPLVPKDRLFAEMIKDHATLIYKFHEHDSLLENKEEETLSEEERKAAWEDFENEKNRPPPAPFPSWPMHNGMVPMLQQQQLAYAAVAAMLRKDMPNLSDDQIRAMLPLIYGANPTMFGGYDYGLMQKLNDMYKYPQPNMMNPALMPMMNPAAGGAGAGAGGSAGLQYEPPWQRQQQQQQQMRLQQLLQHQQNPMGPKLYAGGLGSRDPVAMALQAQRAREMMLERRPRGRPPLEPRPPTTAGDIVNLDSD